MQILKYAKHAKDFIPIDIPSSINKSVHAIASNKRLKREPRPINPDPATEAHMLSPEAEFRICPPIWVTRFGYFLRHSCWERMEIPTLDMSSLN